MTDDQQAYALSVLYGFSPIPKGKYEPDHNFGTSDRFMTLAHWINRTNILIKYDPFELPDPE